MKSIIVGYDRRRAIGAGGDLPWGRNIPSDLKHVKSLTLGKTIIMGRKTFESIGRALPGRENIVVSHHPVLAEGVIDAESLDEAYALATHEIFVFGGASIYEQSLPDVDKIYATEVDEEFSGTTVFFPLIGSDWRETSREHHKANEYDAYDFDFVTYERD